MATAVQSEAALEAASVSQEGRSKLGFRNSSEFQKTPSYSICVHLRSKREIDRLSISDDPFKYFRQRRLATRQRTPSLFSFCDKTNNDVLLVDDRSSADSRAGVVNPATRALAVMVQVLDSAPCEQGAQRDVPSLGGSNVGDDRCYLGSTQV
jgi:hypothetical protein